MFGNSLTSYNYDLFVYFLLILNVLDLVIKTRLNRPFKKYKENIYSNEINDL